jgi:hypothetical protein
LKRRTDSCLSPDKRQFWLDIIQGHASSGLSIEAWCRKCKVPTSQFYAKRKLLLGQENALPTSPLPMFAEIVVQPDSDQKMQPVGPNTNLLIHLDHARIEIPAGFDPATIRAVLQSLQGATC